MESEKYSRHCPECHREITHSNKYNCAAADLAKRPCRSCSSSKRTGAKNSFFGKKHGENTKAKIGQANKHHHAINVVERQNQLADARKHISDFRSNFDRWVEKFGYDTAVIKLEAAKEKQSSAATGSNNPMYGRPAPQGSGNGWSGWYKGWYFRSLLELSYMIHTIERNGLSWESGEKSKYAIKYTDFKGIERTYYPDFVINSTELIECKPQRLHSTSKIQTKTQAAQDFAKQNGFTYQLIEPVKISEDELRTLILSGLVKLLPRYQEKYEKRYGNTK